MPPAPSKRSLDRRRFLQIAGGLSAARSNPAQRGLPDDELRLLSLFNRRGPNVVVMLLFVASGVALVCGADGGLYLLLPAALVAFVSGVLNAWYFLLPPPEGQPPQRPGRLGRSPDS